ncbi:MAG: cell division protein FtsA [Candidatus Omnitrophota bacterium]
MMIGEKIFCGCDIGSQRIKASLIRRKKDHCELLGVNESLTRGLGKSTVNDLGELADCIHYCLKGLMKKASCKVKDVNLGIGGHLIESRFSDTMIPLVDRGNKIILTSDVKKVNKQTCLLGVNIEEEILHGFSQNYIVDDNEAVRNPIGLVGHKLGARFLLMICKANLVNNIAKAVHQAGYEVAKVAFSSLCAGEASLNKKMKEKGCALIDIGSGTTDILIYQEGFLKELDVIHLGGDHVTACLAKTLNLPLGLAEEIKKSYAAAVDEDSQPNREILVKRETEYMPIKRKSVYQSVEPEIARLVNCIENTIKCSKFYETIESGVVMVGGGSLLPGLIERIEKAVHLPVALGKTNCAANRLNSPAVYSAAVGLAQSGFDQSLQPALTSGEHTTPIGRLMNSVKEWYQEYF